MPEHIEFVPIDRPDLKTAVWQVQPIGEPRLPLGVVKWFGRWRCYSFFPEPRCVFEKDCLRAIAYFCECETNKRRKTAKPR